MRKHFDLLPSVAALTLLARVASACTAIGIGRHASADGSVMVAHTDDSAGMGDPRLVRVAARDWPANATRNVYLSIADYPRLLAPERAPEYEASSSAHADLPWAKPLGSIPQVAHTYAYWDVDYGLGNEHALVMAETTCSGRLRAAPRGISNGTALFGIEELSKLALERCATARCAITTMGSLAEAHGYYGGNSHLGKFEPWPGLGFGGEAEALLIGDARGELWIFHILPGPGGPGRGAVWAAQRVPDDSVTVVANSFVIRHMDLSDPNTFLASRDIHAIASELGFWSPPPSTSAVGLAWDDAGAFDFTAAFGGAPASPPDPTGRKELVARFYSGRRMWRVFDLLAPALQLDADWGYLQDAPTYPLAVRPEKLVSVADFFALLRDHYEGTPFDLTAGPAAGPFGSPNRWGPGAGERQVPGGWERAISMHRSLFSFVAQARAVPDGERALSGLVWFGEDSPHATCFVPFYLAQRELPPAYTTGSMATYSEGSAWWAANVIKRTMDLNFRAMREDVRAAAAACERAGVDVVERADAAARALLASASADAEIGSELSSSELSSSELSSSELRSSELSSAPANARAGGEASVGRALERETSAHAQWALGQWRALFGELMVTYKNGYRNTPVAEGISRESGIGYPAWWLKMVGYGEWAARVRARADAADARRAAGEPPRPLAPAPTPDPDAISPAFAGVVPVGPGSARPAVHDRSRASGIGERLGMAAAAIVGALVIFALGVLGGHRLDRITRHHGTHGSGAHAPLLPASGSTRGLAQAGGSAHGARPSGSSSKLRGAAA